MYWCRGCSSGGGIVAPLKETFQIRVADELTLLLPSFRALVPPVSDASGPETFAQQLGHNHPTSEPLTSKEAVNSNHRSCLQIEAWFLIQLVHHFGSASWFLYAVLFDAKVELHPIEAHSVWVVAEQLQTKSFSKL